MRDSFRNSGKTDGKPKRAPVENPGLPGTMLVPLTRGRFAIIDAGDAGAVCQYNWCAQPKGRTVYAVRGSRSGGKQLSESLHRFLWLRWGNKPTELDHINGDGLDKRRANLRAATHAQNMFNRRTHKSNTSGYKGVTWDRARGKWKAQIGRGYENLSIGRFDDPETAHAAYLAAARELHGDFARAS